MKHHNQLLFSNACSERVSTRINDSKNREKIICINWLYIKIISYVTFFVISNWIHWRRILNRQVHGQFTYLTYMHYITLNCWKIIFRMYLWSVFSHFRPKSGYFMPHFECSTCFHSSKKCLLNINSISYIVLW